MKTSTTIEVVTFVSVIIVSIALIFIDDTYDDTSWNGWSGIMFTLGWMTGTTYKWHIKEWFKKRRKP